jgi:hypothetical protein
MESNTETITTTPPRLIPSLTAGFNSVANNIYLILFPVALDLLLWMGPHLRIKILFAPVLEEYNRMAAGAGSTDGSELFRTAQQVWSIFLERFNLFSLLRTLPVGISSLFSASAPIQTPLGTAPFFEVKSFAAFLGFWVLFSLVGIAAGSFYFKEIASKHVPEKTGFSMRSVLWETAQMVGLNLSVFLFLFLLLIPVSLMWLFMAAINPTLAQIASLFMGLILIWLLLPLIFSPHGVFSLHQNILASMLTSVRLVRFFLPGTGVFILMVLLISEGLDRIWYLAPETSWMSLIGVLGHAFITTALISASFSYYLGGVRWMQASLNRPKSTSGPTRPRRI